MARIHALPSLEIIRGLKGILDFYVWRGLPCVRAWPTWRPTRQTDASKAAALTFGAIVKAYALLANQALLAYRQDALDQPRTARDIMVTGAYGNLHEASMSDFLDALIIIRDAVVTLTDLLHALDSIDTDEIVVNVDQSVLPPLAATTTNQATQITALQKLADLQDTLESKALDRLLVRGMDQLYSYQGPWAERIQDTDSAAGNISLYSSTVPADQVWFLNSAFAQDVDSAIDRIELILRHPTQDQHHANVLSPAARVPAYFRGSLVVQPGYKIRAIFTNVVLHDHIRLLINGRKMTLET